MASPCTSIKSYNNPCGSLHRKSSCADCGHSIAANNTTVSKCKCPCEDQSSPRHQCEDPGATAANESETQKLVSSYSVGSVPNKHNTQTNNDQEKTTEGNKLTFWQWILSFFGFGPKKEGDQSKLLKKYNREQEQVLTEANQIENDLHKSSDDGDNQKSVKVVSRSSQNNESDKLQIKPQSGVKSESRPKKKRRSKSADPKNRNKYLGRPLEPLPPLRLKRRQTSPQPSRKRTAESEPCEEESKPQNRPPISPVYSSAKYLIPYQPKGSSPVANRKNSSTAKDTSKVEDKPSSPSCVERLKELQRAMSFSPPCLARPCPCPHPCPPPKCPPPCCPPPCCPPPCCPPPCPPPCPPSCCPPPPPCCPPSPCPEQSITSLMRKRCPSPKTCGPKSKSYSTSPRCVNECVQQFKEEMKMKRKKVKCSMCDKSPTKGSKASPCCCPPDPCPPSCPPPCPLPCPPTCTTCPSPCAATQSKQSVCSCPTCFKPTSACSPKYVPKHPPSYRTSKPNKPKTSGECGMCPVTCMKPCCVPILDFSQPSPNSTGVKSCYPCQKTHIPAGGSRPPTKPKTNAPMCNTFCNPSCVQSLVKSKDNDAYCRFLMAKYNIAVPEYPPICPMPVSSCPGRPITRKNTAEDIMKTTCSPCKSPNKDTTQNHTSNPCSPEKKETKNGSVQFNNSPSKTEPVSQFRIPKRTPVECIRERGPRSPVREYASKLGLPNKKKDAKGPKCEPVSAEEPQTKEEEKPVENAASPKKKSKGKGKKTQPAATEGEDKTTENEAEASAEAVEKESEGAHQNISENKASADNQAVAETSKPVISTSAAGQSPNDSRKYKRAKHSSIRDISKISFPVKEYTNTQEKYSASNSSFYRKFLGVSPKSKLKHDVFPFVVDGERLSSPQTVSASYKRSSPTVSPACSYRRPFCVSPPQKGGKKSPSPVRFSAFPLSEPTARPSALCRSSVSPKLRSKSPRLAAEDKINSTKKQDSTPIKNMDAQRNSRKRKASKSPRKGLLDQPVNLTLPQPETLTSVINHTSVPRTNAGIKRRTSRSVSPRGRKGKSPGELHIEVNPFMHFGLKSPVEVSVEPHVIKVKEETENLEKPSAVTEGSKMKTKVTNDKDDLERMMEAKFPLMTDSPETNVGAKNQDTKHSVRIDAQGHDDNVLSDLKQTKVDLEINRTKTDVSVTCNNGVKMALGLLYMKSRKESSVDPDLFMEDGESSVDPVSYQWKESKMLPLNHTRLEGWILDSKESSVDQAKEMAPLKDSIVNNSRNNSNGFTHNGDYPHVEPQPDDKRNGFVSPAGTLENNASNNNDSENSKNASQDKEISNTTSPADEMLENSKNSIPQESAMGGDNPKNIGPITNKIENPDSEKVIKIQNEPKKPSLLMELLKSSGVRWQKVGPTTDTDISILRIPGAAQKGIAKSGALRENNCPRPLSEHLKSDSNDDTPHLSSQLLRPADEDEGSLMARYKNF